MSEHRIKQKDIIYIIPDDELYAKYKSGEAFIDDYGRLMNKKPHRVLRELKHYVDQPPVVYRTTPPKPAVPTKRSNPMVDRLKDEARYKIEEVGEDLINRGVDKLVYEVIPNAWRNNVVPFFHGMIDALNSKESKADEILRKEKQKESSELAVKRQKTRIMTKEEAYKEKQKVLYHWLEMLNSLKKLAEAGEINYEEIVDQLTNSSNLQRVNTLLDENPNLLETDKYIMLHDLLGRDLYCEKKLIPIEEEEIRRVAENYKRNCE